MKVTATIEMDEILGKVKGEDVYSIMSNFNDNDIMDAIEKIDFERGDWIFLERMTQLVKKLSNELKYEIDDAVVGKHITEDTYEILKQLQN